MCICAWLRTYSRILLLLFIHYLQLGRHLVAAVLTCYFSTDYEDFTLKFSYGGLHVKHVVATWNCLQPSQHLLKDPGKPRKTWDEMAGHSTFRVLTFSQSSGIWPKRKRKKYSGMQIIVNTRWQTVTLGRYWMGQVRRLVVIFCRVQSTCSEERWTLSGGLIVFWGEFRCCDIR